MVIKLTTSKGMPMYRQDWWLPIGLFYIASFLRRGRRFRTIYLYIVLSFPISMGDMFCQTQKLNYRTQKKKTQRTDECKSNSFSSNCLGRESALSMFSTSGQACKTRCLPSPQPHTRAHTTRHHTDNPSSRREEKRQAAVPDQQSPRPLRLDMITACH